MNLKRDKNMGNNYNTLGDRVGHQQGVGYIE